MPSRNTCDYLNKHNAHWATVKEKRTLTLGLIVQPATAAYSAAARGAPRRCDTGVPLNLELSFIQYGIQPAVAQQRLMRPFFYDLSMVDDDNTIGILQSG
jgi:hypothetical protein